MVAGAGPSSDKAFLTNGSGAEPAVAPGVVGIEPAIVILSDGIEGVDQDASSRLFARSTSLVD